MSETKTVCPKCGDTVLAKKGDFVCTAAPNTATGGAFSELAKQQEPLGDEFAKVLYDNLAELYEGAR
jgi:hypothetical protein